MVTLAISYPFLNILSTILMFMALVIWYRIAAPTEQANGLAHVLWPRCTSTVCLLISLKPRLGVIVSTISRAAEVGVDSMAVIRWKDVAWDCGRHAEPVALGPGRPALPAASWTTNIAPDSNGGGSRCAHNRESHQVDVRGSVRTGRSGIGSRRAMSCRLPASGSRGKSFHPIGMTTRARPIADDPLRCRTEAPPC